MNHRLLLHIALLIAVGGGALAPAASGQNNNDARLRYVATARQLGPVGYRDPLGVISPDGDWLAYTSGTHLYLQHTAGGPVMELGPGINTITEMNWLPDSRRLAVRERLFDRSAAHWWIYDVTTGERAKLWPDKSRLEGVLEENDEFRREIEPGQLRYLAWSPDGTKVAGTVTSTIDGSQVWIMKTDRGDARVRTSAMQATYLAWWPDSKDVACIVRGTHRQLVDHSCGDVVGGTNLPEAYGPLAFSPDGQHLYYAAPNDQGTLDLWQQSRDGLESKRLTQFTRDTYAPSVAHDGRILFKVQDYRVSIAVAPAEGGPTRAITTFQSETPSWDWQGEHIAFTYGSWRRVTDDIHYPDIAQHIGFVRADAAEPADAPETIVRSSYSEDQGMHWSPNGQWIAFHTHADGTDDIWLQPADGSAPARSISEGGVETGWPRWSPDGRWVAYTSEKLTGKARHGALYVVGIDQTTGETTMPQREIPVDAPMGGMALAEWSPDSEQLVFSSVTEPGMKAIYIVGRGGGAVRKIHDYASEQLYSGISVSPDFQWVAFIAPASDGFFQVFRIPVFGGQAEQVTFDPTDKTHPSYAPDGQQIAFTVFSYKAHFWLMDP